MRARRPLATGWNVSCDHRASANDGAIGNGDTLEDCGPHADPDMVADQDWLAFSISANDFVIVRVSDRYSIGDCHIVANRNTLKAENGAVIIEIAASKLEAGIACDCNLAASVNLKI